GFIIAHNGFGLCVRAGFGAQSFNLLLKLIRSTKLQICTSARLTQNPCCAFVLLYTPASSSRFCSSSQNDFTDFLFLKFGSDLSFSESRARIAVNRAGCLVPCSTILS